MAVRRSLFSPSSASASKKARTSTPQALVRRAVLSAAETKSVAYTGAHFTGAAGAPSSAVAITNFGTGSTQQQRTANKVLITRIEARLFTQQTGSVRVLLFCPKDPSYTWSTASDIRTFSYNIEELWVFYDKVHTCDGLAISTTPNGVININMKRNQHCHWKSSTANDWSRNPIYIAFLAVNGASASASVQGYIRTYFKDL